MSTVQISATKLKLACEKYLEVRERRILREQEEMISQRMEKKKVFSRKPKFKTREEAKKNILAEGIWSRWHDIEIRGGWYAGIIENLLASSKVSDRPFVNVDVNHIQLLDEYLEKL